MISIILINYNVANFLFNCLNSISKSVNNPTFEVIIVDNNSTENVNIQEKINQLNMDIKFYQFNQNKGFAKAVNYAIDKSVGETILVLNPDTSLYNNSISSMYNYLSENDNVGIVGCKVLYPSGDYQVSSKRHFPLIRLGLWRILKLDKLFPKSSYFGQYNYTYEDVNKIIEVDAVSGSCMMFKRKVINKIGYFDENFFLYFEDTDFCYRAKKYLKVVYNPECRVVHSKGESFKNSKINVNYEFVKSLYFFYLKYFKEYHNFYITRILVKYALRATVFLLSISNRLYKV